MQAITTRYLGPTNCRGSRIVAQCAARRIIVSWDYELNTEDNHKAAAKALIAQLGWDAMRWSGGPRTWTMGCIHHTPKGGYVHVPNFEFNSYSVDSVEGAA